MKAMNDLTRGERLQIMLTKEEIEALDTWRFQKRMPSRAAAIRELLKRGLAAEGFDQAAIGSRSQDYGVTEEEPARRGKSNGDGAGSEG
jgi:antitoxin component HigA of HigAB toxin-antitoxin module